MSLEALTLLAAMADADSIARTAMLEIAIREAARKRRSLLLILDDQLRVNQSQHAAIDEAIRTTQFIRNKCVPQVDG